MDEPDDMRSDGDDIDDADADDGVLNFAGENLLVVQEVTVCNRPFCSISERGVRCSDVDLDAIAFLYIKRNRNRETNYSNVLLSEFEFNLPRNCNSSGFLGFSVETLDDDAEHRS